MRSISSEERRRRLWARHHLAAPADGGGAPVTVARSLVGVHSTDPASVVLALRARVRDLEPADVERALYEDRSLARVLAMRRTMFVVPVERVPTFHDAVTSSLAAGERQRTLKMLAEAYKDVRIVSRRASNTRGLDDPEAWFDRVAEATLAALRRRGEATAAELTEDVPELGLQIEYGEGKKWAGKFGMSTRVLFWLATVGRIVRARPLGSWRSTMYRWAPTEDWLGFALAAESPDSERARAELVRLYLGAFGPATFADVQWWTGWTKTQTRSALAAVAPAEVDLDGQPGFLLDDDAQAVDTGAAAANDGRVALLPPLDSTTMGWKDRDWYLGDLAPHLFDRNGNAGPTVWLAGRIVGGWAQRDDGEVIVRMLVDAGAEVAAAAEAEAARLADWLGEVRLVPRFRTPLELELSA
ncbi:MAG: winged helix DNA-binding domain-containing protein [Thermoanaerobaculia bacterium]